MRSSRESRSWENRKKPRGRNSKKSSSEFSKSNRCGIFKSSSVKLRRLKRKCGGTTSSTNSSSNSSKCSSRSRKGSWERRIFIFQMAIRLMYRSIRKGSRTMTTTTFRSWISSWTSSCRRIWTWMGPPWSPWGMRRAWRRASSWNGMWASYRRGRWSKRGGSVRRGGIRRPTESSCSQANRPGGRPR